MINLLDTEIERLRIINAAMINKLRNDGGCCKCCTRFNDREHVCSIYGINPNSEEDVCALFGKRYLDF